MPAEGRRLCTFSNRNCWQNLSCKLSAALSSSLKKPLTLLIPSPVDTFSKHLLFSRIRAGRSSLVNSTLAAILDVFVYHAAILNFTQYALQRAHAPSWGWVGPTVVLNMVEPQLAIKVFKNWTEHPSFIHPLILCEVRVPAQLSIFYALIPRN